ncbi:Prp21p KNAG_0C02130 [Huiozyma naganishii CBS 8797]|uniref:SURP motif domain-containing protein n=1 Tax=Huiozyma naganishii (strain ATCC MYA-139 / BCRC 22969 / CBS 8797 / KCTC 17520 / NBRC 10181 / NCYC 3082 / Yp74L-3) TaxID=1071383 RepID=J7S4J3_HUIN7|nr:hypothetical protein KNAG_0C02130 [Kazachstania naganishii CBS 8797]CCK69324.1 hypothetical protein KNAG_0C02130 [Kazachstania naganishii CBS 8797]
MYHLQQVRLIRTSMDEELKANIYKTAQFVNERSQNVEEQLLKDSSGKFSFLQPDNEHYAFYQSLRVKDNKDMSESKTVDSTALNEPDPVPPFILIKDVSDLSIPSLDLEIMRRTADYLQYTKEDEREQIRTRLVKEERFQFLNPSHELNPTFEVILKQFIACSKFKPENLTEQEYLNRCFQRAVYNEYLKEFQNRSNTQLESYKIRFAAIDWINFKVIKNPALENSDQTTNGKLEFKMPLDFSKLFQKTISNTENDIYLKHFFGDGAANNAEKLSLGGVLESTVTEQQNKTQTQTNKRKRKGKMIIKKSGETRLHKKKKQ